jgi:hypothetical protein
MKTYSSGRNRVHHSHPIEEIKAAIAEYTEFAAKHPNDPLSRDLIKCVVDLREELTLRGIAPVEASSLSPDELTATAFETVKGRA